MPKNERKETLIMGGDWKGLLSQVTRDKSGDRRELIEQMDYLYHVDLAAAAAHRYYCEPKKLAVMDDYEWDVLRWSVRQYEEIPRYGGKYPLHPLSPTLTVGCPICANRAEALYYGGSLVQAVLSGDKYETLVHHPRT